MSSKSLSHSVMIAFFFTLLCLVGCPPSTVTNLLPDGGTSHADRPKWQMSSSNPGGTSSSNPGGTSSSNPGGTSSSNPSGTSSSSPGGTAAKLNCITGNACVVIGNKNVRSCDLVFGYSKEFTQMPEVAFHDDVIGRARHRGVHLVLSFVMKEDRTPNSTEKTATIDIKDDIAKLTLKKATCSDRKGVPVSDPKVDLQKP